MASATRREWHRTWSLTAAGPVHSAAMAADGSLLAVGCGDRRLYVFDHAGRLQWKHDAGHSVDTVSVSADGSLIALWAADGTLLTFDRSGSPLWKESVPGGRHARVAVSADGSVVATQATSSGTTLLGRDGVARWRRASNAPARSLAMSADGRRVVCVKDGLSLAAFDAGGHSLFEVPLDGRDGRAAISRDGSLILALCGDFREVPSGGALLAFGADGTLLWRSAPRSKFSCFSMSEDGSFIVAGSPDHRLYAFDRKGAPQWSYEAGDWVLFAEVSSGAGVVIAGAGPHDETIYAFDRAGRLQMRHPARGVIRTVSTTADGRRVAVGAGDRTLFVLDQLER